MVADFLAGLRCTYCISVLAQDSSTDSDCIGIHKRRKGPCTNFTSLGSTLNLSNYPLGVDGYCGRSELCLSWWMLVKCVRQVEREREGMWEENYLNFSH